MELVENQLEGKWAVPDHPVTCANPAPWKIIQCRIESRPLKVWIRGDGSMWFRADQCDIADSLEEGNDYLEARGEMERRRSREFKALEFVEHMTNEHGLFRKSPSELASDESLPIEVRVAAGKLVGVTPP